MPVLQFKGKPAIESYHHTVPHHTLEFDAKLSVLGKGEKPSLDGNLIIEGDNLLALKALLPTHAGRIKCIYIDPPYNTGNEGWVYNDKLTQPQFKEWIGETVGKEGEDATRHDKWCCLLYPRLQLLKQLLREDGAIFVSIDDNEVHHLRMMMDEVFGDENRIESIIWKKSYGGGAKSKHFVNLHEYILCYAKDISLIPPLELPADEEVLKYYKYKDENFEARGPYRLQPLATNSMDERPNLRYAILHEGKEIWPQKQWQWSKERTELAQAANELVFTRKGSEVSVSYKQYLKNREGEERGKKPYSIIEKIYTQSGTNEIADIMGDGKAFSFPKPSRLISLLIQIFTSGTDLILDSFAGSGSTAHAVLALNQEDGNERKFILVQMRHDSKQDEKTGVNICRDITAERVRRVIKGYSYKSQAGNQQKTDGLGGFFSYTKLGPALFGEYRELGKNLPAYEELAKYIFYTETSREFDRKEMNAKTGKIGEHGSTSYYLLYTPNNKEDRALDLAWLKSIEKSERKRNLVVYCEKIWVHRDDLAKYQAETNRKVRPMLVPFQLK